MPMLSSAMCAFDDQHALASWETDIRGYGRAKRDTVCFIRLVLVRLLELCVLVMQVDERVIHCICAHCERHDQSTTHNCGELRGRLLLRFPLCTLAVVQLKVREHGHERKAKE